MVQQRQRPPLAYLGVYGIIPLNQFLLLKSHLYENRSSFNAKVPKSPKHEISFWLRTWRPRRDRATLGLDLIVVSIVALHTRNQCSQRFINVNVAGRFTPPSRIIKTCLKITIEVLIKKEPTKLIAQLEHP